MNCNYYDIVMSHTWRWVFVSHTPLVDLGGVPDAHLPDSFVSTHKIFET